MPKYRVTVQVFTEDHVDPADIAEHAAMAIACWGGQYPPDDPLFRVEATATCRGETATTLEEE